MWGIETHEIEAMAKSRINATYLPDVKFPDELNVTTDFEEAISGADGVLIVVPSHAFRETLERLAGLTSLPPFVAWATKGFESESGLLPHQVTEEVLGSETKTAVVSGPTFAAEVGLGLPSAITVASRDSDFALTLAQMMTTDNFTTATEANTSRRVPSSANTSPTATPPTLSSSCPILNVVFPFITSSIGDSQP